MSDQFFYKLIQRIQYLEASHERLARRLNNIIREGVIDEVYPDEGLARVIAHDGKSKKVPWLERSGAIRDWVPPEKGERVILLSPTGEPGKGLILKGGYTDKFRQPHNKLGEAKRVTEHTSDLTTATERVIEAQKIILRGTVIIEGPSVSHNDKNIGDTHHHTDVMSGPAETGPPTPKVSS